MYFAKKAGGLGQAARIAESRCRASLADESCARARVSVTFPVMTSPEWPPARTGDGGDGDRGGGDGSGGNGEGGGGGDGSGEGGGDGSKSF